MVSIWLAAYSLGLTSVNVETKLLWAKIEYIGISTVPTGLFVFSIFYTKQQKWDNPKILASLAIIPLATLILAWTNDSHQLIWRNVSIVTQGSLTFMTKSYGAFFWVHGGYTYLILAASSFLIVRKALATSQKKLSVIIIMGVLAPWISNILYMLQIRPAHGLDVTPYTFAFTGLMLLLILFRFRLLDILPLARSAVIDQMSDGLIILDKQDQIVDLNPVAQHILRLNKYRALGQLLSQTLIAQTEQNSSQTASDITLDVDGAKHHYDIISTPLSDAKGDFYGRMVLLRDITERTIMEAKIKLSEQWYRNLFNASPEAIMLIDGETKIREVSSRFKELTGYEAEQVLGMSVLQLPFLPESSSKIVAQKVALRLEGEEIYPYEIDVLTTSGQMLNLRLFGTLMEDIEKQTTYDLVMALDITTEKKSQAKLQRSEEKPQQYSKNLEAMVTERTQKLKEAQQMLFHNEKLAAIGQLASGVAHQLRNPLGVINNAAYFIQMKYGETDEKLNNYTQMVKQEVENATSIINGILDYTRIRQPNTKPAKINDLLTKVIKVTNIPKNIEVIKMLDKGLPAVSLDTVQVNQALINIISNAIQSMPKGGTLSINSRHADGFVEAEIKDTGCGIPQDQLDRIFEPLYTTKIDKGGTGIGLTLADSVVRAHKGSIDVISEVDQGTSFVVKLPIDSAE